MQNYVFDFIFPSMVAFFNQRLQMKGEQRDTIKTMLKLIFMSVSYKSKPSHEKKIKQFVTVVRALPNISELGGNINLSSLGMTTDDDEGQQDQKAVYISQAQKLNIIMKTVRPDEQKKEQIVQEFDQLIQYIILINNKTEEVFRGANTIQSQAFIKSLISSTDITSDIPSALRTSSLTIIRNIIESENISQTTTAAEWDTDDWIMFQE